MITESDIYTWLTGNATITGLTSSIYPDPIPTSNNGYPVLGYNVEDHDDIPLINGGVSSLENFLVSIMCFDSSKITCRALANAVDSELVGFRGTFGSVTVDFVRRETYMFDYDNRANLHYSRATYRISYA